jgi:hypothetical protein
MMEDAYQEKGQSSHTVSIDLLESLRDYVVRVCVALINLESLDQHKLNEAFGRQEAVDVFTKFVSSADSSIIFIEDSTSIGGEGNPYFDPVIRISVFFSVRFIITVQQTYKILVSVKSDVTRLHSVASNSTAVPCIAFVKVYNAPLQSQRSIGSQVQALTLSKGGDSSGDDGVRSFFTQLQQLTRHLYAPVVRAASSNIEVCQCES